jgi:hypothetical protein
MKYDQNPHNSANGDCGGRCEWCGIEYSVGHRRGSPRRFCTRDHRIAFSSAARHWAMVAVEVGLLSVDDLHAGEQSVLAFKKAIAVR